MLVSRREAGIFESMEKLSLLTKSGVNKVDDWKLVEEAFVCTCAI